jgi:hypothetical protein
MGNSDRPGSLVVDEIAHDPLDIDGVAYEVWELM